MTFFPSYLHPKYFQLLLDPTCTGHTESMNAQNAIFDFSHSESRGKSPLDENDEIISGKLELSKIDILGYLAIWW